MSALLCLFSMAEKLSGSHARASGMIGDATKIRYVFYTCSHPNKARADFLVPVQCSRLPVDLEPWQGNRTSLFGQYYFKRVQLSLALSCPPVEKKKGLKERVCRQLLGE